MFRITLKELRSMLASAELYEAQGEDPDETHEFLFTRMDAGTIKEDDGTDCLPGIYMADGDYPEEGWLPCLTYAPDATIQDGQL